MSGNSELTMFVERAAVIDSAVACPERGLFGVTWLVDLMLTGPAGEPGMVVDFGALKPRVKAFVDARYDHVLLVPTAAPGVTVSDGATPTVSWRDSEGGRYRHHGPRSAYAFLEVPEVTESALAAILEAELATLFDGTPGIYLEVAVRCERIDGAAYQYCHGLEHHAGKCQRIAHGHRSRIEIRCDGRRDPGLEDAWARRWRDVYLATRAHLAASDNANYTFRYRAADGAFELTLPASRCELLDSETTVEQIAGYIARQLKTQSSAQTLEVRAYEGLEKGGIARV